MLWTAPSPTCPPLGHWRVGHGTPDAPTSRVARAERGDCVAVPRCSGVARAAHPNAPLRSGESENLASLRCRAGRQVRQGRQICQVRHPTRGGVHSPWPCAASVDHTFDRRQDPLRRHGSCQLLAPAAPAWAAYSFGVASILVHCAVADGRSVTSWLEVDSMRARQTSRPQKTAGTQRVRPTVLPCSTRDAINSVHIAGHGSFASVLSAPLTKASKTSPSSKPPTQVGKSFRHA